MLLERERSSAPIESRGAASEAATDVWVIEPYRPGMASRAREFWKYRHLLNYFGARALEKSYARTILGWPWIIIRPSFPILVATLIFGNLIGIRSENVPYVLFFLIGSASWQLFGSSLMWVTRSLELNRKLLRKLYFPRLILPVATLTPALADFAIHVALIAGTLGYFVAREGVWYLKLGPGLLLALAAAVVSVMFALGIGFWTSVLGATARDVRFTLGYILQFWYYLTPVIYPLSLVPERWRWLVALNPMAALVETFKWGTLGIGQPNLPSLGIAIAITGLTFVVGLWFFISAEAASVDRL